MSHHPNTTSMTAFQLTAMTDTRDAWARIRDTLAQDYVGQRQHTRGLTRAELRARLLHAHAKVRQLTARIVTARLDLEARDAQRRHITLSAATRRWLAAEAIIGGYRPLESIANTAAAVRAA